MLQKLLSLATDITIEAATGTNPFISEDGHFNSADEAVSNLEKLWNEWDLFGKISANIPKAILFVIIIITGIFLEKLIGKFLIRAFKKSNVDDAVAMFIKRIISFVINFSFILMALGLFININSFLAAIAACGVTIALGLQNSVSQFVSGIQILVTGQFKSGDYISVDGVEGNITEIRFMNTVIHTVDNKKVIIPNSTLTSNKIINFSSEKTRRIDLKFSISYSTDINEARRIILNYIKTQDLILKDPEPAVYVMSHESSSIDIIARVWCETSNYWDVYFDLMENIKKEFDKNNINIPFNQLDVHINNH